MVVVAQEGDVGGPQRRVVAQHPHHLEPDGAAEVVRPLHVRPASHRRGRGRPSGHVARFRDGEGLRAAEVVAGEVTDEGDDVVREALRRAELDPVAGEPGVGLGGVARPPRTSVEVLRRVDGDHHLAVCTHHACPQQVPPVGAEVLSLVDEHGAVGATESLVEGAAHLGDDRDRPRDAARRVELETGDLGVLDDAGAEGVEVGAGDACGVGAHLGAAVGGELAEPVGHRDVERQQEDVATLGGESRRPGREGEGLAGAGRATDAPDTETQRVLDDLGDLGCERGRRARGVRLGGDDVFVELGHRGGSGRGAAEAAHGVPDVAEHLATPHRHELFALVDVDAPEELGGLVGRELGEDDDGTDLRGGRSAVLGHGVELVEDRRADAAGLEPGVFGGSCPAAAVGGELEAALVQAAHRVGEPAAHVDRADAVPVVGGDEVGTVEADTRTDVDRPAVAEPAEGVGDPHPGVVEGFAQTIESVQRGAQHGRRTGGGDPVHVGIIGRA